MRLTVRTQFNGRNASPAQYFEMVAASLPGEVRKAQGKNGSLLLGTRRGLMRETIYLRGDTSRPLSGRLYAGEFLQMAGPNVIVGNRVWYAPKREAETGISRRYGHDKASHWATRAVLLTHDQRMQNLVMAVETPFLTYRTMYAAK